MRILIVDDSRAMQTIVRRGLEKAGYQDLETRLASDGAEALDIIRIWEPHLVLSDWHMPGMTGMELLDELNRQMLSINVGFVTTETSSARINQAMSAGAKFFVHKPFEFESLHNALLPFIPNGAGSAGPKDKEPQKEEPAKKEANDILLPNASALSKMINGFSSREIFIEPIAPVPLYRENFPYLLGLFSDEAEQVVRSVCIFDLQSASVVGGVVLDMDNESVRRSMAGKTLSKELIGACQRIYRLTSAIMRNKTTGQDLHMLSANLVTQPFPKLDLLFQKPSSQRVDFEVAVAGYGQGNVTIVAS